jgi:protein-S-isoprenylcysteine O-methyltransferase Ste14
LSAFRKTKRYDLLVASPLGAAGLLVRIANEFQGSHPFTFLNATNAMALLAVFAFVCTETYWLFARKVPRRFSENLISRVIAITGANIGLLLVLLPPISISPSLQILSSFLMFIGACASTYVTVWLGSGFSVLPQARQLVVCGPYRFVRHPLYLSETVISVGLMLQYREPWALLLTIGATAFQFLRMHYEERILALEFPAYRDYAARTARFLPEII